MTTEDFEFLKEFGKRLNEVNGVKIDVTQLPYTFVKLDFLLMINNNQIVESVKTTLEHLKISDKGLKLRDLLSIFWYLYDELLTENGTINKLENTFLSSNPDVDMIASGVNQLAPFNTYLSIKDLVPVLGINADEVGQKPYSYVLDWQVAIFRQNKVKENYQERKLKKK